MKTNHLQKLVMATAAAFLAASVARLPAQDTLANNTVQPVPDNTSVPQFDYGVSQVLRLAQAEVGDEIIIAYIKQSGNSYALSSNRISYLQEQGVSGSVIAAMLNQPGSTVRRDTATPPTPPTMPLIKNDDPVVPVEAVPATVGNPEPATAIAMQTAASVNTEPVAEAHAEPVFVYYPDPLACGGNGASVTVIHWQSAPASPGIYQRQYSPPAGGYSVVSPGIGFGRLAPAGWAGGFHNPRRVHRNWHR